MSNPRAEATAGGDEHKGLDADLLRRLWPFVRPYRAGLIMALLLVPFADGAHLLQPWLIKVAVDENFAKRDLDGLFETGLLFAALVIVENLASYAQLYLMNLTGQQTARDLRVKVFAKLVSLDPLYFTRQPVGKLLTRVTSDTDAVQEMFASGVVTLISDFVKLAGIITILFTLNAQLALVSLAISPVLLIVAVLMRVVLREVYRDTRNRVAAINGTLNESLNGIALIQGYAREARSAAEFDHLNDKYRSAYHRAIRYDAALFAIVEMASSFTMAGLLWFGGARIFDDTLTFGTLVAFIDWMTRFFIPLRDISMKYSVLQSAMAALEKIFGTLDLKANITSPPNAHVAAPFTKTLTLENVTFAYDNGHVALANINLTIKKGERVALVGATGSGKTTLSRLLNRSIDPTSGRILFDDHDIRTLDLGSYRAQFAIVPQEVFLFTGTLRDNVSLGDKTLTDDQLIAALRGVAADALLARLSEHGTKNPLDHVLTERGANLSGGEAQLIAFARALAVKPEIIVLDEATASIDTETEARLVTATQAALASRTSIIIAHRLSTIRNADRIIVLHKGVIVEEGRHTDLLARNGVYAQLHRLQHELAEPTTPRRRTTAANTAANTASTPGITLTSVVS